MTATMANPRFSDLTREECEAVLARNNVGRIGFTRDERVEILPVHYVYEDGWIFGRTTPSPKLEWLRQHWWVAFEVDEIDAIFDWRSVLVHGGFYRLLPEWSSREEELFSRARTALRRLVPEFFTDQDPVGDRTVVFSIALQQVTGRAAESEAQPQPRPEQ
jgi:uncharacterized protein